MRVDSATTVRSDNVSGSAFKSMLMVVNSHAIKRLPQFDLIYIDRDHSHAGCLQDLELAALSSDTLLVDDYDSIPTVRSACDSFLRRHNEFRARHIGDCLTGFLLLERQ